MAINLAGFLYSDNGTAVQSADVTLLDSGGSSEATTTTNSSGYWSFAEADEDIDFLKDNITTTEVNMARVYNQGVANKKAAE